MAPATISRGFAITSLSEEIGRHIPAVSKIFVDQHGDLSQCGRLWMNLIAALENRSVRDRVYEAEEHLIKSHPETRFDFHVVRHQGLSDVLPAATTAYCR